PHTRSYALSPADLPARRKCRLHTGRGTLHPEHTMMRLLFAVIMLLGSHRVRAEEPTAPRDVEFKAEVDGTSQKYVEIIPQGWTKEKSCDVLIVLHGHGS